MRRGLAAAGAGALLALVAVLGVAPTASAHDRLAGAEPGEGDTVDVLETIDLSFSAALVGADDETANLVQVTGPDGLHYETACASVDGATMSVPVAGGPAGDYDVSWRAVSSDGHPVSGEYTFAYAPGEGVAAADGAEVSPCAALAASDEAAADDGTTAGLVAGLGAGAVVVVILVIIVVIGLRGRKRTGDDPDAA